jgi:hypothetical protein
MQLALCAQDLLAYAKALSSPVISRQRLTIARALSTGPKLVLALSTRARWPSSCTYRSPRCSNSPGAGCFPLVALVRSRVTGRPATNRAACGTGGIYWEGGKLR